MPVITSHHKLFMEADKPYMEGHKIEEIGALVSTITFDILKDEPEMVAGVANGNLERELLETAIIKDMDLHKYHSGLYRDELIRKVFDFMFGYGELQTYVEDEDVTDIDGTRYNEFFIKRKGRRMRIPVNFGNEKIFETYCKLIAVRNRGILNENDSHCRVTDEKLRLRINVAIKPRNIISPSISIRKHRMNSYSLDDLEGLGMLQPEQRNFFSRLAHTDSSVVFCGKGAAGKTTLMRAFINALPEMERVLVVESDAEVFPDKPCCIEQRVRKQNEGGRTVTLRDLVKDGLTMSLDTYCVGEIVGDEAWEFVKAAYTGHRGIATTHSENAQGAFARLLSLSKGANIGESEKTVKEMIGESINYIVFLKEFKVDEILEVINYNSEQDKFNYSRLAF